MATKQKQLEREELEDMLAGDGIYGDNLERMLNTIDEINRLKLQKNAVILAHYYQRDAIKFGVADYIGDSLDLSKAAMETNADIIVFCGVHFMAETAKILNPSKKVLLPSLEAGCSLAESITAEDVRELRSQYPNAAIVTYVNTTADVKAESDVCITSANAVKVIKNLPHDTVVLIPDAYMGRNLQAELPEKNIVYWRGKCIVHEQFTPSHIERFKHGIPGLKVLAHYECEPSVIEAADMHGGTSDMRRYIAQTNEAAYLLATECGLASTIKSDFPEKNIVGPCMLCPYMKTIDIYNTKKGLEQEKPEIIVPESIRVRAFRAIERMFELGKWSLSQNN